MAFSNGPKIITDGLVLNLSAFDRNSYVSGSTTWNDVSGQGNNGTLTNGPTFNSLNGGSIVFDGVDDYVGWDTLPVVKWQNWSAMTFECVFKLVSYIGASNGRQYIVDFRDSGGVNGALGCFYDNGSGQSQGLKLFYTTVDNNYEEPIISNINLNQLYYYQVTFDKTTSTNNIKHYLNGVNVFNRSVTITSNTTNDGRVWMGRYSGGQYQWNGNVNLFKFYNRALSTQEVLQNYNATKSRFGL
jgi:hypothetical protein